jgi:hypothetical protein
LDHIELIAHLQDNFSCASFCPNPYFARVDFEIAVLGLSRIRTQRFRAVLNLGRLIDRYAFSNSTARGIVSHQLHDRSPSAPGQPRPVRVQGMRERITGADGALMSSSRKFPWLRERLLGV